MSITEQLHFSVVSAPIASVDRRVLSQAWYSALYGNEAPRAKAGHRAQAACTSSTAQKNEGPGSNRRMLQMAPRRSVSPAAGRAETAFTAETERRAPRSPLAQKIAATLLHPPSRTHNGAFTVDGTHGRVRVLLRMKGRKLELIAICAPRAKKHVAEALAQARYALALGGIRMRTHLTEAAC